MNKAFTREQLFLESACIWQKSNNEKLSFRQTDLAFAPKKWDNNQILSISSKQALFVRQMHSSILTE